MGEALDDLQHRTTQLITVNKADIVKLGALVWERPRDMSDSFIVLRGTEAHSGASACYDELLAMDLEADPDEWAGTHSWWYWRGRPAPDGPLIDAAHHPQTSGRLPHTQNAAASRQSFMIELKAGRAEQPVPDIAVRGHVHYAADSGIYTRPRTFYCRAWQLTTAYGSRLGEAGYVLPVGTLVLIIRDGKVTPLDLHYTAPEKPIWTPTKK